jgi:transposase
MSKTSTQKPLCAGVDIGKSGLDYALVGAARSVSGTNDPEGRAALVAWCKGSGVQRIGLEASGSYEFEVVDDLRDAGFEVVVFQPGCVRAYAKFIGLKAKTDSIDAVLIARCTAAQDDVRSPPDARLAAFAEHLTRIDQITEDIARNKVRRERFRNQRLLEQLEDEIKRQVLLKREELKALITALRTHKDLARKLDLIASIQGIGLPTALVLVIRMPELGKITREQAASLLGVAPFDHQSGQYKGQRRTGAGRARARTSLFAAAQAAARKWNPQLVALYDRLIKARKCHNVAIIACVRKMIIFANTVLARNEPWKAKS